ncbi:hypothetical protein [Reichenbachiella sp.]|uniref:hypothetical protein n=1 Tax=Reichenbachiella sp. TaxID=2184521 RepID=UPI003298D4A0
MNIRDLQYNWKKQGGDNDNLVVRLFMESRQDKIDKRINNVFWGSILFILLNLIVFTYAWLVLVSDFSNISIRFAGISVLILTYVILYKNVFLLNGMYKMNLAGPIVELQKLIGKLKVNRIRHNRFIFIFSNLYFWSLMILIYRWDLKLLISQVWEEAPITVIAHIAFAILWFPLANWILKKYDMATEGTEFWKSLSRESYLTDESVNSPLNEAIQFIKEIEVFEEEN